ncbi:flavodoxin [Streptococcus massiliensis]|uniref:flavodoxin n=1 Tax=Streptococcus massiliensis TaxID=313439 RepID=UPI001CC2C5DD|nr:flavodoxin [Streptococcus massiliensis]
MVACSATRNATDKGGEDSSTSQTKTTNPSIPQLGLSDDEWDSGRDMTSDGADTNANTEPTRQLSSEASSIVIYFSRSGSTQLLAQEIAETTSADLLELTVDETYPSDYTETVSRANEERESGDYPAITIDVPDLGQYDTVYLGYPIWGMSLASPMASFLESYGSQLTGKTIAPFASNGGYGLGGSVEQIKGYLLDSKVVNGLSVQGNNVDQAQTDIENWLSDNNLTK